MSSGLAQEVLIRVIGTIVVGTYGWGWFSTHNTVVSSDLHLFDQAFWHTSGAAILACCHWGMTNRASKNLGSWCTGWHWNFWFSTGLYYTLVVLCVCWCTSLSSMHGCALGVVHWCAAKLGSMAAGACCMLGVCVHAYGFEPCWRHQRCLLGRLRVRFLTTLSNRCFHVWWNIAPAVVHNRYDLCHSWHITVPGIHIPLEVSSIENVQQTVVEGYVHFNHGSFWHDLPYPPDAHSVHLHEAQFWMAV